MCGPERLSSPCCKEDSQAPQGSKQALSGSQAVAKCIWFSCHCRKAALQVSMNDGLSFISSSVIITTTHCVSENLSPHHHYLFNCSSQTPAFSNVKHEVFSDSLFCPLSPDANWVGCGLLWISDTCVRSSGSLSQVLRRSPDCIGLHR